MNRHGVEISDEAITAFCRRHHICRLALYGSILREDFTPQSDVDVLVEFEQGQTPSVLRMAGIEIELSEMIGRRADLRTSAELSRHFRAQVLKEAQVQYVAA